jgi:hypothetical protein
LQSGKSRSGAVSSWSKSRSTAAVCGAGAGQGRYLALGTHWQMADLRHQPVDKSSYSGTMLALPVGILEVI